MRIHNNNSLKQKLHTEQTITLFALHFINEKFKIHSFIYSIYCVKTFRLKKKKNIVGAFAFAYKSKNFFNFIKMNFSL